MSPLDMSVLLFFILIAVKAFKDSVDFWKEQDARAAAAYKNATSTSKPAVSATVRKTRVVTRTPVRVPYRVYRVDMNRSVSLPDIIKNSPHRGEPADSWKLRHKALHGKYQ